MGEDPLLSTVVAVLRVAALAPLSKRERLAGPEWRALELGQRGIKALEVDLERHGLEFLAGPRRVDRFERVHVVEPGAEVAHRQGDELAKIQPRDLDAVTVDRDEVGALPRHGERQVEPLALARLVLLAEHEAELLERAVGEGAVAPRTAGLDREVEYVAAAGIGEVRLLHERRA